MVTLLFKAEAPQLNHEPGRHYIQPASFCGEGPTRTSFLWPPSFGIKSGHWNISTNLGKILTGSHRFSTKMTKSLEQRTQNCESKYRYPEKNWLLTNFQSYKEFSSESLNKNQKILKLLLAKTGQLITRTSSSGLKLSVTKRFTFILDQKQTTRFPSTLQPHLENYKSPGKPAERKNY